MRLSSIGVAISPSYPKVGVGAQGPLGPPGPKGTEEIDE